MRLVLLRDIVEVDNALDAYRNALTDLLVYVDQAIRHHNTAGDAERREVWKQMRPEIVKLRDGANTADKDATLAGLARMAAGIA